jgi:penicillin-binding protein 1A
MRFDTLLIDDDTLLGELKMPELQLDLLPEIQKMQEEANRPQYRRSITRRTPAAGNAFAPAGSAGVPAYNPILDGDLFNARETPAAPARLPVPQALLSPAPASGVTPAEPPSGGGGEPAEPPVPETGYTPALPPPDLDNPAGVPETNGDGEDNEDNEFSLILPDYNPLLD